MNQHLDPERLAAMMEGSLSRAERAALEAHAADCGHCLQLLAAMARTAPETPARGWRLPVLARWAVPIAAAATAVALWVNVDRPPEPVASPSAPGTRAPVAAPPSEEAKAPVPAPSAPAPAEARHDDLRSSRAKAPARSGVAEEIARDEAAERARVAELPSETAAGVAATPAPVDRLQAPMFARQARSVVEFTSPDPLTRWRLAGMSIQRSGDGGKTWSETVVTHAEVRAGASPSANVAWIVGHGGLVMRTTDGGVWKRLEFPDATDLVSVRAASALGADVTAADGRVFRTTDGGVTWVLQENPGSAF